MSWTGVPRRSLRLRNLKRSVGARRVFLVDNHLVNARTGGARSHGALHACIWFVTWCFTIGGLLLSHWAAIRYVPAARAALREGRVSAAADAGGGAV